MKKLERHKEILDKVQNVLEEIYMEDVNIVNVRDDWFQTKYENYPRWIEFDFTVNNSISPKHYIRIQENGDIMFKHLDYSNEIPIFALNNLIKELWN